MNTKPVTLMYKISMRAIPTGIVVGILGGLGYTAAGKGLLSSAADDQRVAVPWGSASTTKTLKFFIPKVPASCILTVDFPDPLFWFTTAMIFAVIDNLLK